MAHFREPSRQDWKRTIIYLVVYLAAVILVSVLIIPRVWPGGAIFWTVLALAGLLVLVRWHARSFGYRCQHCGNEFEVSTFADLVSPHGIGGGGWKSLRCPRCGHWTRAKVLKKE